MDQQSDLRELHAQWQRCYQRTLACREELWILRAEEVAQDREAVVQAQAAHAHVVSELNALVRAHVALMAECGVRHGSHSLSSQLPSGDDG